MTIAQVGVSYWSAEETRNLLHSIEAIDDIDKRQTQVGALHDQIYTEALGVTAYARAGDWAGADAMGEGASKHLVELRSMLEENRNEALPASLSAAYAKLDTLAVRFSTAVKAVVDAPRDSLTATGQVSALESAHAAFDKSAGSVTEAVDAWKHERRNDAEKFSNFITQLTIIIGALTVLAVMLLPVVATRAIFRPQRRIIDVMDVMAGGDYDVEIQGTQRQDEMGEIARAVQIFKENGQQRVLLERQQELTRAAEKLEDEKRTRRSNATDAFANRMKSIIETVAAAATEMYRTSEAMGYSISSASTRVGNVASASTQTSMNVQSVAAAAEELSATVREIAEQIARSNSTVREAVGEVAKADSTALSLDEATKKIGQIVDVIQTIASQINLLALNATIESARAGEAGKGFAVVAGEVKTLATQTSKATDEIASNIASIQEVSSQVIESLHAIKGAIARVDEISSAISAAVEEQNATTNEIASNMGTAASGTAQINDEINQVSVATAESSDSASQVLDAAKMLSQEAEKLSREVQEFMAEMNA